jgi:Asp-tRNA(Asn)/Glu-tRNA(Gln) amidotransferase A subunit family amidase
MLITQRFDDARLLQLARTFECAVGWRPQHPGDPRVTPG